MFTDDSQVARFFLVQQNNKTGENIPNGHKICRTATKYAEWPQNMPNGRKIYQHLFCKSLQNLSKLGFLVRKCAHLAALHSGFSGWETFFFDSPFVAVIDVLSAQGLVGILSVGFCLHRFQAASTDYRELLRWIVITDRI
jgi:hypothetical protein